MSKKLYIRRVENGLIVNHKEDLHIFVSDNDLQAWIGEMFVIPDEKNIEYKITITVE